MESTSKKKVILVVEDDEDALFIIEKVLSHRGYSVLMAKTGKEALAIVEKGGFDLILLDIALPDINGVELAKILREKKGKTFPIIGVSGHSIDEISIQHPEARVFFTDFFLKPIFPQTLTTLIEQYL